MEMHFSPPQAWLLNVERAAAGRNFWGFLVPDRWNTFENHRIWFYKRKNFRLRRANHHEASIIHNYARQFITLHWNSMKKQFSNVIPCCNGACAVGPTKGWKTTGQSKRKLRNRKRKALAMNIDLHKFRPRPIGGIRWNSRVFTRLAGWFKNPCGINFLLHWG